MESPPKPTETDFSFGFDDFIFSDRTLRIEILSDLHNRKRRRTDNEREEEEPILSVPEAQFKTLRINSLILAAKSVFFRTLFSNGMSETGQAQVNLTIDESEESGLMGLLKFFYTGKLDPMSPTTIIAVLLAADKYESVPCMTHCNGLLCKLPMTVNSALIYLEFPESIKISSSCTPLIEKAREYLAGHFRDLKKFKEEAIKLPLSAIEAILLSSELTVPYEDYVFEFVLEWARAHYPKPDDTKQIISRRLLNFVRFPQMTFSKLEDLRHCSYIEPLVASDLVCDALCFKAAPLYRQRTLAAKAKAEAEADRGNASLLRFAERDYKYKQVKMVEFEAPHQQCVVYFDLKREDCTRLFPTGRISTQDFCFGDHVFFLTAICNIKPRIMSHRFGITLGMKGDGSLTVECEFASRTNPHYEAFQSKVKRKFKIDGSKGVGVGDMFGVEWNEFISAESPYFVNDVLHLRAVLTKVEA